MGQVAYFSETGEIVEAFSTSDTRWEELCAAPHGTLLMPRSAWPAVPKTSIRGLRFFAHHPGYTGLLPKPESYAHTRLKVDIVKAARALGYHAELEAVGYSLDGTEWIADVLVTKPNGNRTAFEVQLSSQHLRDFRSRTERYRRSNVECCWVISNRPVDRRLSTALAQENMDFYHKHGEFQSDTEELILFGVSLDDKNSYPAETPQFRFSRGPQMRNMPIQEAIQGMLQGAPLWRRPRWYWGGMGP